MNTCEEASGLTCTGYDYNGTLGMDPFLVPRGCHIAKSLQQDTIYFETLNCLYRSMDYIFGFFLLLILHC